MHRALNLPNLLTLVRLPLTFAIVGFMYARWAGAPTLAFWLFIAAALSDWLDGKLARERGIVSDFGKFMDALADKILVIGVMMAVLDLDYVRQLPKVVVALLILIVITREFTVSGLRMLASVRGVVIAAERGGKVKAVIQMIGLGFLLAEHMLSEDVTRLTGPMPKPFLHGVHWIGVVLFCLAVWFTVTSMIGYLTRYRKVLEDATS